MMAIGSLEFMSETDGTYWASAVAVASATALASRAWILLDAEDADDCDEVDVDESSFGLEVPLAAVIV